jgi:pimeloyl-ACP methyl ester carboxylesterase
MPPNRVEQLRIDVDGVDTFYRRVGGEGTPTVFIHGNPTHSADWMPFLERIEGPAIAPDLPGFGSSQEVRGFDHSMHSLATWVEHFLATFGIDRHKLVVHDWGSLALIGEQRNPQRLERLVIANAVPLLPGYRWHPFARIWRTPVLGGLANATATRRGVSLALRQARADGQPMPDEFIDMIWSAYRRGRNRPVLELYRSADPELLAAAGADLGKLECPALIVWGDTDRYLPLDFARAYADVLPKAELLTTHAGHWPWVEDPQLIDRILGFLSS